VTHKYPLARSCPFCNSLDLADTDWLDEEKPMELDRAKTIADVAQALINSAKVEVDFMKTTGQMRGSGFIPDDSVNTPRLPGDRR
jgi:hypothetical protein